MKEQRSFCYEIHLVLPTGVTSRHFRYHQISLGIFHSLQRISTLPSSPSKQIFQILFFITTCGRYFLRILEQTGMCQGNWLILFTLSNTVNYISHHILLTCPRGFKNKNPNSNLQSPLEHLWSILCKFPASSIFFILLLLSSFILF